MLEGDGETVTDLEQGLQADAVEEQSTEQAGVNRKSRCRKPRSRIVVILLAILCVLVVLVIIAVPVTYRVVANMNCGYGMSPPYASNRVVSTSMCVTHQEDVWTNANLTDFLLPAAKTALDPPIRFLVVGDFGRDGFCCQRDVAVEMDRAARDIQAEFVINTGDAFYDFGINSPTNEQVTTSFLGVYNYSHLSNLTFYSVLGNHEYRGSAEAVLQLPNQTANRFSIDARWYSRMIDSKLQLVFLDTSPMIDTYRGDSNMNNQPDGVKTQWDKVEDQVRWLEETLNSTQDSPVMRLMIGHHPPYDLTSHGDENRAFLETRVVPLLEKYNVTASFTGHDHNLQMIQPAKTAYFVSGAGSKLSSGVLPSDTEQAWIKYYFLQNGFHACTVYRDELRVAALDLNGNVLNQVIVPIR